LAPVLIRAPLEDSKNLGGHTQPECKAISQVRVAALRNDRQMRETVLAVLSFILVTTAASTVVAGPIRLGVEPMTSIDGPILVRVSGHYISIHNGNSHHWKDDFIPAGGRHFIPLGPVNPLINVGVSVRIIHPEIVSASARSSSTPLLLRPVGFDTFEPLTWEEILERGETRFGDRPETPAGHVLAQAYWHLRSILEEYLPALDDEGGQNESSSALPNQLALLERIARHALDAPPQEMNRPPSLPAENLASYRRSLREQDLKFRVELEEALHRLREWLSLDRDQRRLVRSMMQRMQYPQRVADQLMTRADRQRLGEYLAELDTQRALRQAHPKSTSWVDATTRVAYRVRMLKFSGECVRLNVQTDLTLVVPADVGDMTHSVEGRFCRDADGLARFGNS
jgi:hypothetical protein